MRIEEGRREGKRTDTIVQVMKVRRFPGIEAV